MIRGNQASARQRLLRQHHAVCGSNHAWSAFNVEYGWRRVSVAGRANEDLAAAVRLVADKAAGPSAADPNRHLSEGHSAGRHHWRPYVSHPDIPWTQRAPGSPARSSHPAATISPKDEQSEGRIAYFAANPSRGLRNAPAVAGLIKTSIPFDDVLELKRHPPRSRRNPPSSGCIVQVANTAAVRSIVLPEATATCRSPTHNTADTQALDPDP